MSVVGVAERAGYVGDVRTAGTCLGSASTGALMARPLQGAACVPHQPLNHIQPPMDAQHFVPLGLIIMDAANGGCHNQTPQLHELLTSGSAASPALDGATLLSLEASKAICSDRGVSLPSSAGLGRSWGVPRSDPAGELVKEGLGVPCMLDQGDSSTGWESTRKGGSSLETDQLWSV